MHLSTYIDIYVLHESPQWLLYCSCDMPELLWIFGMWLWSSVFAIPLSIILRHQVWGAAFDNEPAARLGHVRSPQATSLSPLPHTTNPNIDILNEDWPYWNPYLLVGKKLMWWVKELRHNSILSLIDLVESSWFVQINTTLFVVLHM